MFPTLDSSSLLFLLLGKENPWLPWILLGFLIAQKSSAILAWAEQYISGMRWRFSYPQYILEGTLYTDKRTGLNYGNLSEEIQGFLYFLQSSKVASDLHKGITIRIGCGSIMDDKSSITIPVSGHGVWVIPDAVYARFEIKREKYSDYRRPRDEEESPLSTTMLEECKLRITLQGRQTFAHLRAFVLSCEEKHTEYMKLLKKDRLYVVKPSLSSSTTQCSQYIPFKSTKTFENLFFKDKATLLARLEEFKAAVGDSAGGVAQRMGLPSTLGLLFYGEPGTGKTSAIKAIANYMQMHLIIVPMSKIHTRQDLERIFYDQEVCYLPAEKRIYVFEEIDCNGWERIVVDRKFQKPEDLRRESVEDWDSMEEATFVGATKAKLVAARRRAAAEKEDKLTLGALLEILDGVVECPGRMIIMTTNRRGVLDTALIRPGRIDMEIEFGRLGRAQIGEIYERMWGQQVPDALWDTIPEGRYTQAEVAQKLYGNSQDPNKFLSALIE